MIRELPRTPLSQLRVGDALRRLAPHYPVPSPHVVERSDGISPDETLVCKLGHAPIHFAYFAYSASAVSKVETKIWPMKGVRQCVRFYICVIPISSSLADGPIRGQTYPTPSGMSPISDPVSPAGVPATWTSPSPILLHSSPTFFLCLY